jgi:hypothetical protein
MRFPTLAAAASLLALLIQAPLPAAAQTPPSAPAAPAPAVTTPAPRPGTPFNRRQPLVQRFAEANTTHDGHLTLDQANAARWFYIEKNFSAIDKDHKGYVSVDDIRGYAATQRAARRASATAPAASKT